MGEITSETELEESVTIYTESNTTINSTGTNYYNLGDSLQNITVILPIDMRFNSGHVVSISVYSVLFLLSSAGNITLLLAILRRRRPFHHLSRIDFLLLHLVIADLIVTFFMMPLEIGWAATVYWMAGDFMCRLMSFLRIFGLYLSGFLLVCLAIDRYMAVAYPMHGISSSRRAKIMTLIAWILAIICSLPQVFVFHVESHPYFTWYTQCVTFNSFKTPEHEIIYQLFGMIMMYALPLILLMILYGSIAFHLHRLSPPSIYSSCESPCFRNSAKQSQSLISTVRGKNYPVSLLLRRTGGSHLIERAKMNSIKMTFVITAVFMICWTPYYFMCLWYWIDPETAKNVDQKIQKGLFLFASANPTVNPIVYGIFHMKSMLRRSVRSPAFTTSGITKSVK